MYRLYYVCVNCPAVSVLHVIVVMSTLSCMVSYNSIDIAWSWVDVVNAIVDSAVTRLWSTALMVWYVWLLVYQ